MHDQSTTSTLFGEQQPPTAQCTVCKERKTLDQFSWNTHNKGSSKKYRCSLCRPCKAHSTKRWVKKVGKVRAKESYFIRQYGLSSADYAAMVADQGGACAVCGDTEMPIDPRTGDRYNLAVDHDHATGKVRALLCPSCNNGLGCFRDDLRRLQEAASYLRKHGKTLENQEG